MDQTQAINLRSLLRYIKSLRQQCITKHNIISFIIILEK